MLSEVRPPCHLSAVRALDCNMLALLHPVGFEMLQRWHARHLTPLDHAVKLHVAHQPVLVTIVVAVGLVASVAPELKAA